MSAEGWSSIPFLASPASCMPDACFCEHVHEGWLAQPANTLSNLAFLIAGVAVLHQSRMGIAGGRLTRSSVRLYGWILVALAFFSAFFHSSLTFVSQWLDVFAIYLIGSFILVQAIRILWPVLDRYSIAIFVTLNLALGVSLAVIPGTRRYLFGGLLLLAVAAEGRATHQAGVPTERLKRAGWVMLPFVGIWILDLNRVACSPESWIQGHAAWHLGTATAAYLLWVHYRNWGNPGRPAVQAG